MIALKLCLLWSGLPDVALAFSRASGREGTRLGKQSVAYHRLDLPLFATSDDDDDEGEDWRAFRAKLVMSESSQPTSVDEEGSEKTNAALEEEFDDGFGALFSESASPSSTAADTTSISGFTPLDPSQWAYDSGKVVEKGAVILGGVEQDFGFGLRQQYFHKAVILVLDHDENTFTKGIILNRPSDRMMEDDVNEGLKWRVWFGGDVQGLDSILPDIVCLHSLKSKEARDASVSVMKDIQVGDRIALQLFAITNTIPIHRRKCLLNNFIRRQPVDILR